MTSESSYLRVLGSLVQDDLEVYNDVEREYRCTALHPCNFIFTAITKAHIFALRLLVYTFLRSFDVWTACLRW